MAESQQTTFKMIESKTKKFQAKMEFLEHDNRQKRRVIISNDLNQNITFGDFIKLVRDDEEFLDIWCAIFVNLSFDYNGYYWECPPVTKDTLDSSFECMIIYEPAFQKLKVDLETFDEHFKKDDPSVQAVAYWSLSKKCRLISPNCLSKDTDSYCHIGEFMASSLEEQKRGLWKLAVQNFEEQLQETGERIWFSCAGRGIYYVHVRAEGYPKYYRHKPYKAEFANVKMGKERRKFKKKRRKKNVKKAIEQYM